MRVSTASSVPRDNYKSWSDDELQRLFKLYEEHGKAWTVIATQLGTGRSADMCRLRMRKPLGLTTGKPSRLVRAREDEEGEEAAEEQFVGAQLERAGGDLVARASARQARVRAALRDRLRPPAMDDAVPQASDELPGPYVKRAKRVQWELTAMQHGLQPGLRRRVFSPSFDDAPAERAPFTLEDLRELWALLMEREWQALPGTKQALRFRRGAPDRAEAAAAPDQAAPESASASAVARVEAVELDEGDEGEHVAGERTAGEPTAGEHEAGLDAAQLVDHCLAQYPELMRKLFGRTHGQHFRDGLADALEVWVKTTSLLNEESERRADTSSADSRADPISVE